MSEGWRRFALSAFLLLALVFVALALGVQWGALQEVGREAAGLWTIRVGWLIGALLLGTANLLLMASLWTWLARRLGEDVRYGEGVVAWVGANLGRYIPGKVWQLAGLAAYMRGRGRSSAVALVSALVFQILVLISGIAAVLLTLRGRIGSALGGSALLPLLVAFGLALLLHPGVLRRTTVWFARLLREEMPEVVSLLERDRARGGAYPWVLGVALLAAWWVYGAGFWCLITGITEIPVSDISTSAGIFAASYVAGYLAFVTPGGLIVREGALTLLLVALTPLPAAAAAVVAVAARIWTIASELAAFGCALAFRTAGEMRKEPEGKHPMRAGNGP